MEVPMLQLPPGDPGLIDKIVCQLKSNGIFDQFRKECIADVDTKPAYQNLRQRVEGSVSSFLMNQEWRADLNKNQLRDSLRKNIHESGFLDIGVERIVDQVVNPKIYTVFFPKVEDVVYGFLGVEKPKKGDIQNGLQANTPKFEETPKPEKKFVSLKDLLPTDLDPISPEKLDSDEDIEENSADKPKDCDNSVVNQTSSQKIKVKEEITSDIEHDYDEDEKEDEEDDDDEASPPFESLETDALDANATPPVLPIHSADMLDNITSSSSSSETKDLLQYGEVRKRCPDPKLDFIKKEADGEVEKHMHPETFKVEVGIETSGVKKECLEPRKESKKSERKEEKTRDNNDRKDEVRSRKSNDPRDKHSHEKKRSDRDQAVVKQEKDDSRRSEKDEQRKTLKDEHRKNDKDEHKKSDKDEHRKSEKDDHRKGSKDDHRKGEKEELKKSEKDDHKRSEKDEHKKSEKEEGKKDDARKSEKIDKKHGEKVDRDSSRRHDREKEERKSMKEKEDKDKKHVREKEESKRSEKDDHRKPEKDESRKSDKERSENKKRDKKDEKKPEKERDEKKLEKDKEEKKASKEKDDVKKSDRDDVKKSEKEENRKIDKEKDKHRSGKEKTDHGKGDKDTKERIKSEHKEKEVKHSSAKPGMETPKKEVNEKDHNAKLQVDKKKEEGTKKSHHRDSSKNGSSKDKKVVEKDKKVSTTDDHRHERVKGKNGHRRSDRDKDRERERSQADGTTQATVSKDGSGQSSSTSSTPSSEGSKGGGDSSSGSGGSERVKEEEPKVKAGGGKEGKQEMTDKRINEIYSSVNNTPGNLVLKIKKPKIAANIYEVKKIMQVRKNLKKLERERLASSYANKVSNQIVNEAPAESASALEEVSESKTPPEPPKVKRAKLGAVEQDLRVEVESVLEKSLLDDEDGEIGEVHYLENDANLPDFVHYVRGLEEEAAMGDYSRVPSPTNSITTAELSDFEDNVILSDVELSKEEEDVVMRLGGYVERKSSSLKSPKKSSPVPPLSEVITEGSNKRPRRPNPRYSGGEYTVYSDDDEDVEDDMIQTVPHKKVDGIDHDHGKTPKEIGEEETDAIGSGGALPTPENDAGSEDRETPILSKRNQAAIDERRRIGRRLGIRGPLRRVAGVSPGTPDNFVMPLSPESDVSTASGDAGKKVPLNTKALENQYHQDMDGELGPDDYDDAKGSEDGDNKHPRLPLGPPLSSDIRSHASDLHHSHNEMGQASSVLMDGDKRIEDPSGLGPRRLRGTRSSVRVQQRYSSDDLYKPRPNITLGRRNRGRNSPTQDDPSTPDCADNFMKQGRRGSSQGSDELLVESCPPNKRRRR